MPSYRDLFNRRRGQRSLTRTTEETLKPGPVKREGGLEYGKQRTSEIHSYGRLRGSREGGILKTPRSEATDRSIKGPGQNGKKTIRKTTVRKRKPSA